MSFFDPLAVRVAHRHAAVVLRRVASRKGIGQRRAAEDPAETYRVLGASVVTERQTDLSYVRNFLAESGEDASEEAVVKASAIFAKAAKTLSVTPHKNETVAAILRGPIDFMPYFFRRKWILAQSKAPFLTSDRPVVLIEHRDPKEAWRGVGLATADLIIFVLDRRRVLIMQHPLPEHGEGVIDIEPRQARVINSAVANHARKWLFHHPDDDPLLDIPFNPKADP